MPEQSEVSHITDQLNFFFKDRLLDEVEILNETFLKRFKDYEDLVDILPLRIKEVKNKGKLIIFYFYNKIKSDKDSPTKNCYYLFSHLTLFGHYSLNYNRKKNNNFIPDKSHVHVKFTFKVEDNDHYPHNIKHLYYSDKLRFSNFHFMSTFDEYNKKLKKIEKGFIGDWIITKQDFINNFKKYKENKRRKTEKEICVILTDQKTLVSGVGNYLVSEILYLANVNPWKLTSEITEKESKRIYDVSIKIIKKSYDCNGMSFSDYSNLNDDPGSFQNYLEVYMKKKTSKGEIVLSKKKDKDRTIYYVKNQGKEN
jgi:formamidopyrimidine-DNA glycosylase